MSLIKILAAILCSQFTVEVVPSFTVSVEPGPEDVVQVLLPPVEGKKKLYYCVTADCSPCQRLKDDIDAGLFDDFEMILSEDPNWDKGFPVIKFQENGKWVYLVDEKTRQHRGYDRTVLRDLKIRLLGEKPKEPSPVKLMMMIQRPVRHIYKPEWGNIDLETYYRNCSCGMCVSIRALQAQYWKDLKAYEDQMKQTSIKLPDHQQPTPPELIDEAIEVSGLTEDSLFCDIGCGEGQVCIAAVKKSGCQAKGVEIDKDLVKRARLKVKEAGLEDKIEIIEGDAIEYLKALSDKVTVAYVHLYPSLLEQLKPDLAKVSVVLAPYHVVPGLGMNREGNVWVYRR